MNTELESKLGVVNWGSMKGSVCIILYECDYIKADRLKWFKILVENQILSVSNNNVSFL